jgi:hypothetical protein
MGTSRPPSIGEAIARRLIAVLVEVFGQGIAGVLLLIIALLLAGVVFIPTLVLLIAVEAVLHPSDAVAAPLGIGWIRHSERSRCQTKGRHPTRRGDTVRVRCPSPGDTPPMRSSCRASTLVSQTAS